MINSIPLNKVDYVADILFDSFISDPIIQYIMPVPQKKVLLKYFRSLSIFSIISGRACATNDYRGVALWISPRLASPIKGMIKSGIICAPFTFGLEGFVKINKVSKCSIQMKKKSAIGLSWQLMAIGVHESSRHKGIGRSLILDGFAEADKKNQPCYLETANKNSKIFFEELGFNTIQEKQLVGTSLTLSAMIRKPFLGSQKTQEN